MALQQSWRYDVKLPKSLNPKKTVFGIAEKKQAAENIAKALDPKSKTLEFMVKKQSELTSEEISLPKVSGYLAEYEGKQVVILFASGHLFTLESDSYGWQFPVYDFKWVPLPSVDVKDKRQLKKMNEIEATLEVMRIFIKNSKTHIIMTDYDDEGEVIGGMIVDQLSGNGALNKARRMNYSSLTAEELIPSFKDSISKELPEAGINWGNYSRGLMRHYLDWLWGINLSRALMLSLKNSTGRYYTLSTGRVQGPTLSFVADKEAEISLHVPIPSFAIDVTIKKGGIYKLNYKKKNLKSLNEAVNLVKLLKSSNAIVTDISQEDSEEKVPTPYNLNKLNKDASKFFGMTPSDTMSAAESLYLNAYISYPRTESEKYPPNFNHKENLGKLDNRYSSYIKELKLMNKKFNPIEGKKTDPAHPCIYPTGKLPGKLRKNEANIYLLVLHRYFATFGKEVKYHLDRVNFDIQNHDFSLSGKNITDKGWRKLYPEILNRNIEDLIPKFKVNESIPLNSVDSTTKYTNPPGRWNQTSLVQEMIKNKIGTKATQPDIVRNLISRKFVIPQMTSTKLKPLEITPIGMIVNDVLKTYSPQVISVELSRKLEEMGDQIVIDQSAFSLSDAVVRGIEMLHEMLEELMNSQDKVGDMIFRNLISHQKTQAIVGPCHLCETGELRIIRSKASGKRFIGCSNYFTEIKCKNSYALPQKGRVEPDQNPCKDDGFPQVKVITKSRPWNICTNPTCKLMKQMEEEIEKRKQRQKEKELEENSEKPKKKTTKATRKNTAKKSRIKKASVAQKTSKKSTTKKKPSKKKTTKRKTTKKKTTTKSRGKNQ